MKSARASPPVERAQPAVRMMRFPTAVWRDPAIEAWVRAHTDDLGRLARRWLETMRGCGDDVRELMHDGQPTLCVGDAAFAYVAVSGARTRLIETAYGDMRAHVGEKSTQAST